MFFKIELNPRLGRWVIYVANHYLLPYVALREGAMRDSEDKKSPRLKTFENYHDAFQFATTTGLTQAYVRRNYKDEDQAAA